MKQLKLVLAFVLVVFLLPACSDSDDDLLWLPGNTPAAEEVDDGNDDNGTGDEDPQGYGILLAAPYNDEYEDVVAWAQAVDSVVDFPVSLGFTNLPDWDDKKFGKDEVPPDVPTITAAALEMNSHNLAFVAVFKVVVCPDGEESAAMVDEMDVELGNLLAPYSVTSGFGLGDFMVNSVLARVAKVCSFTKDDPQVLPYVKPGSSSLIVTMLECADSVPQSSIDALKSVFGQVAIYDMDNFFWVVLFVNILDGGKNVIVPYFTTLNETAITKHALMTMGGALGIMQEGSILSDESAIGFLMTLL